MPPPERKPGSNLGRPAIDWQAAFAFYASSPPERRSYSSVANEFGVSLRTVERHGRLEKWGERTRAIEARAAEELERRIGQERAEQRAEIIQLGKATLIRYATQLTSGDTRISASEFEKISKFLLLLLEESGQALPVAVNPVAAPRCSREHKLGVLRALHESGALEALQRELEQPTDKSTTDNKVV